VRVPAPRVGGTVRRSRIRRSRRRDSRRLPVRCTGNVGETDSSFVTRRNGPVRSSALRREDLAARPGHAPTRPLARCSATTARGFRAALPGEWFFPLPCARHTRLPAIASPTSACARRCSFSPGGAPGVHCALRRFAPASGWSRRANYAAAESRFGRFPRHFCPTGPTCRSRRIVRASRLIFVGMIGRRLETRVNQKGGRSADVVASTSGLRLPSAVRFSQHTFGREIVPALGFASCRVGGHMAVHRVRARPRSGSPAPEDPRPTWTSGRGASPIRSWV
jgi:hypothetical protein